MPLSAILFCEFIDLIADIGYNLLQSWNTYYSDNHQSDNEKIFKALEKTIGMIKNINEYEHKVK